MIQIIRSSTWYRLLLKEMPTRIEVLPEDIKTIIYKKLYSSILRDMSQENIYKNAKHFHNLLEFTSDPLVYDLDYLGMLNINNIYDIFKYKNYELFQPETAIYQRSHFTKNLDITLDNIEISNEVFYALYKSNKRYYWAFAKEYATRSSQQLRIHKGTFIFEQPEPFSCMAELLYNVIVFYNRIKDVFSANIRELECLEDDIGVLTRRQRKDKYIMEDILGYHINNRFIIRFDYDIDMKSAFPILLPY